MRSPDGRPALRAGRPDGAGSSSLAFLPSALGRGLLAFAAIAAIGQALALAVWAVADTGASLGAHARIGWIYLGAFHHVAIELDVSDLDVAPAGTSPGSTSLSVGVALLAVTAIAVWLLWRAGRAVAGRVPGGPVVRMLCGATVAVSYAVLAFVVALLVEVRTPLRLGAFASGELHVSLSAWQAVAFPLAIGAVAGAAGGLASALDDRGPADARLRLVHAAVGGGWRMFVLGLVLSIAGLFVAGVVQPEEPVALLTPSTARYVRSAFERPEIGLVLLGHHVAAAPNEAMWTLVPAMGGCDAVRGSANADLLCYGRFPTSIQTAPLPQGRGVRVPVRGATFGVAPAGYLLFLLVPAIATVLGGRRAAGRLGRGGGSAIAAGAAAGAVFAVLVAATALASSVTIGYGAAFGRDATGGWVLIGPNVTTGTLLALGWGVTGGVAGSAWAGRSVTSRSIRPARRRSRTAQR